MTDSSRVAGRLRCSESARFIFTVVNFDSEFNDKWSITTFSTYPIIATPLSNGQEGGVNYRVTSVFVDSGKSTNLSKHILTN